MPSCSTDSNSSSNRVSRIDHIIGAWRRDSDVVLGTVVDLQGSGYRRPGARILIRRDGSYTGAISGGCLERDVARNAWNWVDDGPETVAFDTRANEFQPAGQYGTGCDGIVKVRLVPPGDALDTQMTSIARAYDASAPIVLRHPYGGDDELVERIDLTEFEAEALDERRSIGVRIMDDTSSAEVLFEYVAPPLDLLILGAGDDAAALVEVAETQGWRVRVASTDPLKLRERFDPARTLELLRVSAIADIDIRDHTRVVLMSHDFEFDVEALPAILTGEALWIGILGPRARTGRVFAEVLERGAELPDGSLGRIKSPVGLAIGGEDAWQVAVSIVAQIIADSNDRDGGELARQNVPIHDPHRIHVVHLTHRD